MIYVFDQKHPRHTDPMVPSLEKGHTPLTQDARDLLLTLNAHHVPYLIVGAHALAFHGYTRPTRDFDLFVAPIPALLIALTEFGIPDLQSFPADSILRIGSPPIDITSIIDAIPFDEAWSARIPSTLHSIPVHFPSFDHTLRNKLHSRRPKDQADARRLIEARISTLALQAALGL